MAFDTHHVCWRFCLFIFLQQWCVQPFCQCASMRSFCLTGCALQPGPSQTLFSLREQMRPQHALEAFLLDVSQPSLCSFVVGPRVLFHALAAIHQKLAVPALGRCSPAATRGQPLPQFFLREKGLQRDLRCFCNAMKRLPCSSGNDSHCLVRTDPSILAVGQSWLAQDKSLPGCYESAPAAKDAGWLARPWRQNLAHARRCEISGLNCRHHRFASYWTRSRAAGWRSVGSVVLLARDHGCWRLRCAPGGHVAPSSYSMLSAGLLPLACDTHVRWRQGRQLASCRGYLSGFNCKHVQKSPPVCLSGFSWPFLFFVQICEHIDVYSYRYVFSLWFFCFPRFVLLAMLCTKSTSDLYWNIVLADAIRDHNPPKHAQSATPALF